MNVLTTKVAALSSLARLRACLIVCVSGMWLTPVPTYVCACGRPLICMTCLSVTFSPLASARQSSTTIFLAWKWHKGHSNSGSCFVSFPLCGSGNPWSHTPQKSNGLSPSPSPPLSFSSTRRCQSQRYARLRGGGGRGRGGKMGQCGGVFNVRRHSGASVKKIHRCNKLAVRLRSTRTKQPEAFIA